MVRLFALDLNAVQIAALTGASRNAANRYPPLLRERMAACCKRAAQSALQDYFVSICREIGNDIMGGLTGGRHDGNEDGIPDRAEAPQYADDGLAPEDTDNDGIPDCRGSDAGGAALLAKQPGHIFICPAGDGLFGVKLHNLNPLGK